MISRAVFILLLATLSACSRYELVPDYMSPECADYRPPNSGLVELVSLPDAPLDTLVGRVVARSTGLAVQGTLVRIDRDSSRTAITDKDGRFAIAADAGTHRLDVARIGYNRYTTTITLPFNQRSALKISLAEMMLDGPCSGFGLVEVKKPWWKIW